MNSRLWLITLAGTMMLPVSGMAQASAGATGQCRDGSYTTAPKKAGACSGHKGVQDWYANSGAAPSKSSTAPQPSQNAAAPTPSTPGQTAIPAQSTPASVQRVAPAPASAPKPATATPQAQAPGGGPGMVWVNMTSKVYHCPGTKFYGTTKNGKYMSEAAAKADGDRADHGKVCTQ